MIGFRYEVGGDWWNYLYIYNSIKGANLEYALGRTEPGYGLLNYMAAQAGWGIWFPNVVCATIFTVGLLAFCRRQPNPALALVVAVPYFIIGVGMGYTRQSAAIGFVLLALNQYERSALIRMALCIGFAVMFHSSAIIMAPILALASARRGIFGFIMLAFLGGALFYQLLGGVLELVTVYTVERFSAAGAVPRLLMNVLPAIIFLGFRNRFAATPEQRRLWTIVAITVLLSLVLLFFVSSSTIVDRLGIYLIPLQIFVLSRLPGLLGTRLKPSLIILLGILVYSLAIELVWLNFGAFSKPWLPYRNYLWDTGTGKAPPRWYREAA